MLVDRGGLTRGSRARLKQVGLCGGGRGERVSALDVMSVLLLSSLEEAGRKRKRKREGVGKTSNSDASTADSGGPDSGRTLARQVRLR